MIKAILYVFLVALFLLPVQSVSAQGPRSKKKPTARNIKSVKKAKAKKTSLKKTAIATKVANPVPKKDFVLSPIVRIPPAVFPADKLPFFPPSPNFVPSTKSQMMISIRCSENKFLWATTESMIYFSPTFVKVENDGPVLVLQENGQYTPFDIASVEQTDFTRPADVKFAEKIVRSLRPKKLTIMPKLIALEKDPMKETDPMELVEIIRDHIGRENTDVNVQKYGNCYKASPSS